MSPFLCVCVNVCVHVWERVFAHTHWRKHLAVMPHMLLIFVFEIGSLTNMWLSRKVMLAGQWASGSLVSPSLQCSDCKQASQCLAFFLPRILRRDIKSSHMQGKHFTDWAFCSWDLRISNCIIVRLINQFPSRVLRQKSGKKKNGFVNLL